MKKGEEGALQKGMILLTCVVFLCSCGSFDGTKNLAPEQREQETESPRPAPEETPSPVPEDTPLPEPFENTVLGTFETPILDKYQPRIHNIRLASDAINRAVIQPGEVFSFNQVVGERTAKRGYQKALIIVDDKKKKAYGGGVCQISTTIYQAAMAAGLEIVERHQHEKEIGYVKLGDDATVSFGTLDLKVKNTKEVPLRFEVSVSDSNVSVAVIEAK